MSEMLMLEIVRAPQATGPGAWWQDRDEQSWVWRLRDVSSPHEIDPAAAWVGRQLHPGDLPAPASARGVLAVFQEPMTGYEDEFNAFMDAEHVPALGGVTGVLAARRYVSVQGEPKYLGIYHLTDLAVCASAQWRTASDTPWRERIRPHTHKRSRHELVPVVSP